VLDVPPVAAPAIAAFLLRLVTPTSNADEAARLVRFAELLGRAARGSAARLDRVLGECTRDGWFLAGEDALRLRPGPLPTQLGEGARDARPQLTGALAMLLAALHVGGASATVDELQELAQLGERDFARTLSEAIAVGELAPLRRGGRSPPGGQLQPFSCFPLAFRFIAFSLNYVLCSFPCAGCFASMWLSPCCSPHPRERGCCVP